MAQSNPGKFRGEWESEPSLSVLVQHFPLYHTGSQSVGVIVHLVHFILGLVVWMVLIWTNEHRP